MAMSLKESIAKARKLPKDTDLLIARAELLAPADRELMEAIMVRGQSAASVARMTGRSARSTANRAKRLAKRLSSKRFLDAARALPYLDGSDARLACLRFCAGMSVRKLAEQTSTSPHVIRRRLDRVGAQILMIRRMQRAGGRDQGRFLHQAWSFTRRRSK